MPQPFDSMARRLASNKRIKFLVASKETPRTCENILQIFSGTDFKFVLLAEASNLLALGGATLKGGASNASSVFVLQVDNKTNKSRCVWRGHLGALERTLGANFCDDSSDEE